MLTHTPTPSSWGSYSGLFHPCHLCSYPHSPSPMRKVRKDKQGAFPIAGGGGALLGVCTSGPVWLPVAHNIPEQASSHPVTGPEWPEGSYIPVYRVGTPVYSVGLRDRMDPRVQPMLSQKTCFTKTMCENPRQGTLKAEENFAGWFYVNLTQTRVI